jgi:hypothetical protein
MSFFLQVGRLLVEVNEPGARLVVGVTVPTRAYAAVLAGAGVVLARADLGIGPSRSAARHFEYLASLPEGTSVTWHTPTARVKTGRTAGVKEFGGRRLLMIQTQASERGGLRVSCDERDCLGVQPVEVEVPLRQGNERGRPLGPTVPFLSSLVPRRSLFRLLSESTIDCLILGVRRRLVREAESAELGVAAPTDGRTQKGAIASILRIRDPHRPAETFRTVVANDPTGIDDPAVVIFDGPRPYLKWQHRWLRQPSLLVLDRSDARAADGAAAMNEDYVTKRLPEWDSPAIDLPEGVEMACYVVGVSL